MRRWAAVTAATMILAGCASGDAPGAPATPTAVACPEGLVDPTPVEHGLGVGEPASTAPSLGSATQAWLCTYAAIGTESTEPSGGSVYIWNLAKGPAEVPAERLGDVDALVSSLVPADDMRECTADLGPRVMLVVVAGGTTTGVVVDDYGCRDVRLTDDPWEVAPGESTSDGVPAGVLQGPDGMIAELDTLAGL